MGVEKITADYLKKGQPVSFQEAVARIKKECPDDPLEKRGMTLQELDRMLEKHQSAPQVREAVAQMMATPSQGTSKEMTVDQVIEVHARMAQELQRIVRDVKKSDLAKVDPKLV